MSRAKVPRFSEKFKWRQLFINETDPTVVSGLLDKIYNNNKATDVYGIPPKLVKMAAGKLEEISYLSLIIQ